MHMHTTLEIVANGVDMSYSLATAVLLQLMLARSELVAYQSVAPQKLIDSCQTTHDIICEDELVLIGVCLTRLSNDSEIAVYGPCPYVTGFTSTYMKYQNYYHIKFELSTLTEQTCGPLNRKGLLCSECYEGYGPAVYAFGSECVKCYGSVYGRWALYLFVACLLYTSPSPRDATLSRMPSSA